MDHVREVRRAQRSPFAQPRAGILGGPDILGPLMEGYPENEEPEFTRMDKRNTWDGRMVNDVSNTKEI